MKSYLDTMKGLLLQSVQIADLRGQVETIGTKLQDSLLAVAKECGTVAVFIEALGELKAYIKGPEGRKWAKHNKLVIELDKEGNVKLPQNFVQYVNNIKGAMVLHESDITASVVPHISTFKTEGEARTAATKGRKVRDAAKLAEEAKSGDPVAMQAEHDAKVQAANAGIIATIGKQAKTLSGDLGDQCNIALSTCAATVAGLVEQRKALEAAESAKAASETPAPKAKGNGETRATRVA